MKTSRGFGLTLVLSLMLLGASVFLSQSAQDGDLFGDYYTALIILNAVGIAILALLTFIQVRRLFSAFRARTLGSRLTLRFIATFAVLTLVPLAMVYYFSVQFLSRSIDSWFDVRIEKALDDALLLGRSTLEATKLEVIRQARIAGRRIELTTSSVQLYSLLDRIRETRGFDEMSLHSSTGRILASSSNLSISLVPDAPGEQVLGKVRRDSLYAEFEPTDDGGLRLRVAVPVSGLSVSSPSRVLQILYPLPLRYSRLGESVESASSEYDRLKYLRGPLTLSFVLSLTLITLMTLLMALWASIYLAQRMLAPLRDAAEAHRRIDADPAAFKEGGVTPGVMPWVRSPADHLLLRSRYDRYMETVRAATSVLRPGAATLLLHTYAPRSVGVEVELCALSRPFVVRRRHLVILRAPRRPLLVPRLVRRPSPSRTKAT